MFRIRILLALVFSVGLSYHGFHKKSLSISGACAAFLVGLIAFSLSYRYGAILIVFYLLGSRVTRLREDIKSQFEDNHKKGGQRNYVQVLCNSLLATMIALYFLYNGFEEVNVSFNNNNK